MNREAKVEKQEESEIKSLSEVLAVQMQIATNCFLQQ